jgi:hypothetical protein
MKTPEIEKARSALHTLVGANSFVVKFDSA